ncbi:MAG: hypothetical protein H7Z13_03815 [Ferruginibacter sp.]|nr:hypothetical protein [Ferruginibacter sp.]
MVLSIYLTVKNNSHGGNAEPGTFTIVTAIIDEYPMGVFGNAAYKNLRVPVSIPVIDIGVESLYC